MTPPPQHQFEQHRHEPSAVSTAFALLAPGVQRQLWRMGWTELRSVQMQAIHTLIQSDVDLVIASETASGKTESAFLPILSMIADECSGSVRALYIGPLRALINDQFQRLEQLCQYLEMPTHRWHGDVSQSAKAKLLKGPAGVLLITPESLESLFINRTHSLLRLFGGLRFVVIDELHSFLDNERGTHLQSLLCRLRRVTISQGTAFRVVGLSATIGDFSSAQQYVNRSHPESVELIADEKGGKELKYRLYAYRDTAPPARHRGSDGAREDDGPDDLETMRQVAHDLVEHCSGTSNLIFANAKGDIELYADLCNETARDNRQPESFLVHHGSLSRDIREDTETAMKGKRAMSTICSSTLEMGIDIGSVRMVGQIGPPWSVASLKQRLGRSGRKEGDPRVLRMYIPCRTPDADASILERLHLDLVQAIAVSELLLEGWIEPPSTVTCDLSTLSQQIMSVIAETGGLSAELLYDRLVTQGAFEHMDPGMFAKVLTALGHNDVIEQAPGGDLILGLEGERIRASRDFYAAFQTPAEFSVTTGEKLIGTLPILVLPAPDDHMVLGGCRWKILAVDVSRAEILVASARSRKRPIFGGGPGAVHERIRQRMRVVLAEDTDYVYLSDNARSVLEHARQEVRNAGLIDTGVLAHSDNKTLWFTWTDTHTQVTLLALLAQQGLHAYDRRVAIELGASKKRVLTVCSALSSSNPDPLSVAEHVQPKARRKYDHLLTDDMLNMSIAHDVLNLDRARQVCRAAFR